MKRVTTRGIGLALAFLSLLLPACGAASASTETKSAANSPSPQHQAAYSEESSGTRFVADSAPATLPPPPGAPPSTSPAPGQPAPLRELLVYEATLSIAVYQVERGVADLLAIAKALDGNVVQRGDDRVIFRVPRARFEEALARADAVGDVLHRDVRAEDVGDQFRDLEVRLRNARAMRDRLEQLLARATNVKESLDIEAQMSRVTLEIELLAGQLQLLGHRIAYSKVTVLFQPRHPETLRREVVRLPFPWLGSLRLGSLLDLKE